MEAQKENSHSNHKLSPEERIENALVRKSLQDEMASLVITKAFEESRGGISDQIKVRTIEKRLDDIEDSLDDVDDLTIVMSEYDSQASLHETSRLDLLARKFDRLTKGATQAELVELYGVVAVSYGEDSALLAHIAQRIEGDTDPDTEIVGDEPGTIGSASGKSPENKKTPELKLPKTFAEARKLKGNSIEDYLRDIPKIEDPSSFFDPVVRKIYTSMDRAPEDKTFFIAQNVKDYEKELTDFADRMKKENPYEQRRPVNSDHIGWLQFDSKAFIEAREKRQSTGDVKSRIYLNPRFEDLMPIYKEIYAEAEAQGLVFKSKVFDPALRESKDIDAKAKKWENYDSVRIDPLVIYGYESSEDQLLQIVNGVYEKYQDSFRGRRIGAAPVRVAPGFAVGAEPTGFSGSESLTSHRGDVLGGVLSLCKQRPEWSKLGPDAQKKLFAKIFRDNTDKGIKHNIDPSNIAFDLEVQPTTATLKTPEQERQPSLKERYDLPGGFRTEKGSVYRYSESGKTKRHKFDHTERGDQRMGIAVFYPDIPAYRDIITRIGAEQGHMPKNKQRRGYIIEDDSKAPQGYRRVYDIARVNNPQNLHFALIKNDGTIDGRFPVSIIPQKGLYVFEMGLDKRGRTIRHPGHKVTEILEKDEDVIRAWGKLAKQAKK